MRTKDEREGAWCVRRRKGGGSVEARKARGTSKNDRSVGERGREGEAYIGNDRDRRGFPNNAASERSDRVSRGELVQETRHIEAREKKGKYEANAEKNKTIESKVLSFLLI